jgi:ferritin-like metal-binding protein YciE
MSTVDSLRSLVVEQLRDIYDAEKRLTKAIPKLRKKAVNEELQQALEDHLGETEEHIARLERAFEAMDEKAKGKPCAGMRGIIEEGDEHVGEDYDDDDLRDAVIIGSAQRVEHYEIAAYGTVIAHARLLGEDEIVALLEETLEEEKATDMKLTEIAERVVNVEAADESDEEEEEDEAPMRGRATAGSASRRVAAGGGQRIAMAADRGGRGTRAAGKKR